MVTRTNADSERRELQTRRRQLLAALKLPPEGLPGSLTLSRRRCGTRTCHCQEGEGHPSWALTYMVDGRKRVEHVPHEDVEDVRRRVEEGNAFKSGLAELMAINARLMVLERRERKLRLARARKQEER